LLDRIDLHVEVPMVDFRELTSQGPTGEKSETIRERVVQARKIQDERFRKSSNTTNASMSSRQMKQHCKIDAEATDRWSLSVLNDLFFRGQDGECAGIEN
jgi:magnesium chelatase family protein